MKILLTSLILVSSFHFANSQSFYVKIGGGYAFPLASGNIGENQSSIYLRETDPQSGSYVPAFINKNKVVKGSYTSGITASATAGYMFSESLALEVNLSYTPGKEYKSSSIHQDMIDDAVINTSETSTVTQAKTFIVTPSVRFTALSDNKLRPFITGGPAISFSTLNSEYQSASDFEGDQSSKRHEKYSGGISIGFRSTVGLELTLTERLSLFCEGAILVLSYYPGEKEITKYEVDNEDLLSTLNVRQRQTVYVKSYNTDTRTNENINNEPTEALRFSFGMSSIAVMTGLKITL